MVPNKYEIEQLLKKYAPNNLEFESVLIHGKIVAEIALWCAKNTKENVNIKILEAACLLHDIGSYPFLEAGRHSKGYLRGYHQHALLGAKILEDEGIDIRIWQAVETHPKLGLSQQEIIDIKDAFPYKDYQPRTIEARLLCYADRFHQKLPNFNQLDSYVKVLELDLPKQAEKMLAWSKEFGVPDIEVFAKKYGHPLR